MLDSNSVSIIVPVYNQAEYLKQCLDSVVALAGPKPEVVVVDDGSTDGSGAICDEYAKKNGNFKVIHQQNGGLSVARNVGIENSSGEYIAFLDSDDFLNTGFLKNGMRLMKERNADVVVMNMKYVRDDEDFSSYETAAADLTADSARAIEESLYQKRYSCCAPGKIYRRSVVDGIRFPEGRLSEDLAVCHLFLDNAETVVYSETVGYYYRQQPKSIMHTFDERRMDALEHALKIENFCRKKYPSVVRAAKCRTFNVAVHLILDMPEDDGRYAKQEAVLKRHLRRTRLSVVFDAKARGRERCAALLSFFGTRFLRAAWNSGLAVRK